MGTTQGKPAPHRAGTEGARGLVARKPKTVVPPHVFTTAPEGPSRLARANGFPVLDGLASGEIGLKASVGPGLDNCPDDVRTVQRTLNAADLPVTVDGFFGPETETGIKAAQERLNRIFPERNGHNTLRVDGLINPAGPTQAAVRDAARQSLPTLSRLPSADDRRSSSPRDAKNLKGADVASLERLAGSLAKTSDPGPVAGDVARAFRKGDGRKTAAEFGVITDRLTSIGAEDLANTLTDSVRAELAPDEARRFDRLRANRGGGTEDGDNAPPDDKRSRERETNPYDLVEGEDREAWAKRHIDTFGRSKTEDPKAYEQRRRIRDARDRALAALPPEERLALLQGVKPGAHLKAQAAPPREQAAVDASGELTPVQQDGYFLGPDGRLYERSRDAADTSWFAALAGGDAKWDNHDRLNHGDMSSRRQAMHDAALFAAIAGGKRPRGAKNAPPSGINRYDDMYVTGGEAKAAKQRVRNQIPLSFNDRAHVIDTIKPTRESLDRQGLDRNRARIAIIGSAVTGKKYNKETGQYDGPRFDGKRDNSGKAIRSDLDMAIVSPDLFMKARKAGVGVKGNGARTYVLDSDQMKALGLRGVKSTGRTSSLVIYKDLSTLRARGPHILLD